MLSKQEFQSLAKLCRLNISGEELHNLQSIIPAVAALDEIDTSDVEPCSHVLPDVQAPLREDVAERVFSRDHFLKQAPEKISGMVKVPPVIKED